MLYDPPVGRSAISFSQPNASTIRKGSGEIMSDVKPEHSEPKWIRALPFLRCPRSGTPLSIANGEIHSEAGDTYPIVNGKAILVRTIQHMHVTPPDLGIVSQNAAKFAPSFEAAGDAVILHLGSGNVPSQDQRVLSIDILPNDNVDIVAEAEALPFADDVVDYLVSGAVFEHLYDPIGAIREVKRILKTGGLFRIDTAFLQSYHGFPSHFFNMTPQAVETYLVDDFQLERALVPASGSVSQTLIGLLGRLVRELPPQESENLKRLTVGDLLEQLRKDPRPSNPILSGLSEYSQRSMCASFVVEARKPAGYRAAPEISEADHDMWQSLKRDYYASRVTAMLRDHEIKLYQSRVISLCPNGSEEKHTRLPLAAVLNGAKVKHVLDRRAWQEATSVLSKYAEDCVEIRNYWIRRYMSLKNRNPLQS